MAERFSSGDFVFELVEGWGKDLANFADDSWGLRKVVDIGIDAMDRIFLLSRSSRPIIVSDKNGQYLTHWQNQKFSRPHGISFNSKREVYIVDDDAHLIQKYDFSGNLLMELGVRGKPAETGCINKDYRTVKRAAGPFCYPTAISEAPDGELYVSDGYGNARIHRFSHDGVLIQSWGEPGVLPGQFFLPHGVLATDQHVFVADRENNRIQIFDRQGRYQSTWDGFIRPTTIRIGNDDLLYISEAKRCDLFDNYPSTLSIVTVDGEVLARIDNRRGTLPFAKYHCAHCVNVDSEGSVYIGEVGDPPEGYIGVKKYKRIR